MKPFYYIAIIITLLAGCKGALEVVNKDTGERPSDFEQLLADEIKNDSIIYERIDTLIVQLVNSEYTGCDVVSPQYTYHLESYAQFIKNRPSCNEILSELLFYHSKSLKYERYIYDVASDIRARRDKNKENWLNCILLLPKSDCTGSGIVHRLNMLPYFLSDTSSVELSIERIDLIAKVLDEPCSNTLKFLQSEVEWRKSMYDKLIMQLAFLMNKDTDEYGYMEEDIYWIFHKLPDRLTTRFAYDYIMNNEIPEKEYDCPSYIFDIIDWRLKDWGVSYGRTPHEYGYTYYKGESILLSKDEIKNLIARAQEINKTGKCDWCDTFIFRLKLGLTDE